MMNPPTRLCTGDSQSDTRLEGASAGSTLQVSCPMVLRNLQPPPLSRPRKKRRRPGLGVISSTTSTCDRNWSLGMLTMLATTCNSFVVQSLSSRLLALGLDTERRGAGGVHVLKPVSGRPARVASAVVRAARLLDSEGRVAKNGETMRTQNRCSSKPI